MTWTTYPTFGIVKPAVTNIRVDMCPYGQSVFVDAVDAFQSVGLISDALISEVDVSKMRVFLSDVRFNREKNGDESSFVPFEHRNRTVFRKVVSIGNTIQKFASALRDNTQTEVFHASLRLLEDLTDFGLGTTLR